MNERIKELAGQANIHFSRIGILDGDPDGTARLVGYSKMEKFVELIVEECLMKVNGAKIRNESYDELIERIKEDFGVE